VDDDLLSGVERGQGLLDRVEPHRAGDPLGFVGPLGQRHDELELVLARELLAE
jgi:hypothetical protein